MRLPRSASVLAAVLAGALSAQAFDVTTAGVIGDGVTLNTGALQNVIDATSAAGGGTLDFPAGHYLTGTIQLKSNITLYLAAGAVLLGSTNPADYRQLDPFTDGLGAQLGHALLVATDAQKISLAGEGEIDGQAPALKAAQPHYTVRPFLTRWIHCANVTITRVTLRNPGAWTNHFFQCSHVTVDNVTIRSQNPGIGNNDGIDIDSSQDVQIRNCDIDSGDDAVCCKATSPEACRDIVVTGCQLRTRCNGVKLGTESIGDFSQIRVDHCQMREIGLAGIALYSVDGAHLLDVVCSDISMAGVSTPISIRLGARLKTFRPGEMARTPGVLRGVTIRNVHATGARRIGVLVNGLADHPVAGLTLQDILIELPGGGTAQDAAGRPPENAASYPEEAMFGAHLPAYGFFLRHVRGCQIRGVKIVTAQPDARPERYLEDVQEDADFAGHGVAL